jgi:hypothetical protein
MMPWEIVQVALATTESVDVTDAHSGRRGQLSLVRWVAALSFSRNSR